MPVDLRCAAFIALATLASAHGISEKAIAQEATGAPLQLAIDSSPAGLDPHIVTAFNSVAIVSGTIYEGLTAIDKDLQVVPGLAESWSISPDGLIYTFKLRPGVTFHDGTPLAADDVVSSLRRVQSKEVASPLASRLVALSEALAVDPLDVELKLKEPSAPLLAALAGIGIVPRSMEANKEALQKTPIGTGPFKFEAWQPNGFILLSRNLHYREAGKPKLAGLKFNIVPEAATRAVGLESGQYELLPQVDAATALELKEKPGIKLSQTLELSDTVIGLNVARPPFADARVREAVNYALDRQAIIDAALFGAGVPAGPLSPVLKSWARPVADFPCYRHDPQKARALLEEAGFPKGTKIVLRVLASRQDIKDIAQVVQAELGEVGIGVELANEETGQFVQDWRNGNFDLFASANAGGVDPDEFLYRTFHTGGSTNVFRYSDATVDHDLEEARRLSDRTERKAIYDRLQMQLACSGPIVAIAYGTLFSAARAELKGYEIMANRSLLSLRDASLSP
ncbi:MAG: ABC transporter substrate-binding protein [Hyphomicrobiales bacterium]|nr:ABC transporter substrate-binding protein [Hyphomicrobiales bacterium]